MLVQVRFWYDEFATAYVVIIMGKKHPLFCFAYFNFYVTSYMYLLKYILFKVHSLFLLPCFVSIVACGSSPLLYIFI